MRCNGFRQMLQPRCSGGVATDCGRPVAQVATAQRIWADRSTPRWLENPPARPFGRGCNGFGQTLPSAVRNGFGQTRATAARTRCNGLRQTAPPASKPTRGLWDRLRGAKGRRAQVATDALQRLPKSVAPSPANGCQVCPNPLARPPATVAGRRRKPLSRKAFRPFPHPYSLIESHRFLYVEGPPCWGGGPSGGTKGPCRRARRWADRGARRVAPPV